MRGLAELVEVRARSLGGNPGVAQILDRGDVLAALRQLLPVLPEQQAVMDVFRRLEAERASELLLKLAVRTMVGAADDVRDLEVGVVDDAREVVCRTAVGPKQGQPAEAERALGVLDPDARRRLAVPLHPSALTHRPLVPADPEPFEVGDDPLLRSRHLALDVRVVDPQQEPVAAPAIRDGRERTAEMKRAGRAGGEASSDGHPANLPPP